MALVKNQLGNLSGIENWNIAWDILTLCMALDSVYNLPLRITDQGM